MFLRNIEYKNKLHIITTNNPVNFIDKNNYFKNIIIRNNDILTKIRNKIWLNKTIIHGLNVNLNNILTLKNYQKIWIPNDQFKSLYIKNGIKESKIEINEPILCKYDFKLPKRNDNEVRLIYCGTLREKENILEIIKEFQKIHKERPEVLLKIVYGKIHGNINFRQKIKYIINKGVKGIIQG